VTIDGTEPAGHHRTDEIREVAAELFSTRGYSATTMTNIADAAGVFPGSLYHHFASKEDMAIDILERFNRELHLLGDTLPTRGSVAPEVRLSMLVEASMTLSQHHAAAIRLRAFEPPTQSTERLHAVRDHRVARLEEAWQTAVDDIVPRESDRPLGAALLGRTLQDLSYVVASMLPPTVDASRMARNAVTLLLHGIAPHAPSDEELDGSFATAAAVRAMATWPRRPLPAGADVRDQIVAAARTEFARRGYDATTIRDLAQAAGMRMGSLYRRVSSKEEVGTEIIGVFNQHFGHAIRAVFDAGDSEVATLDAMARVFVHGRQLFAEEAAISRYGWRARTDASTPSGILRLQGDERLAMLLVLLNRGMASGSFRQVDSAADIGPLLRFICWSPYAEIVGAKGDEAHRFVRSALLRGYVRPT
jgi:AcrR family transcriptional regulator